MLVYLPQPIPTYIVGGGTPQTGATPEAATNEASSQCILYYIVRAA